MICTAGHEDSIEIRNGHKEDGFRYDPEYPAATMLVPRYLRLPVRGRIGADGQLGLGDLDHLGEAAVAVEEVAGGSTSR